MSKLWSGRFQKDTDALVNDFNESISFDQRLYRQDIAGSKAHSAMLAACGIISREDMAAIHAGLDSILADIEAGKVEFSPDNEDIHMNIETLLTQRIGDAGKRLHTARSRNDQCNVDMKLYVKRQTGEVAALIDALCAALEKTAQENPWIMPGYTHLQRAQVVTFRYHLLAYREMLLRDKKRLRNAADVMDECPLGCGALAGTTHAIDRAFTAEALGFSGGPCANFIDGVSDRDFVLEVLSDFSILMMHLSRLAEELILWSSAEFGFIELDDRYTTGSSIMPQKKNPDGAELVRGRTGRVYGDLMALLCAMKGLPLAYNKDMQQDKDSFADALDVVTTSLLMMERMIATLQAKPGAMRAAVTRGFLNATEVADYLVARGVPFRDAHGIVGQIVLYCEDAGKSIEALSLEELRRFSPVIEEDIFPYIDYDAILQKGIKKEML